MRQGFTLIELSIVLVIIGLIVGGVLVGRDLISAAQVRAQISQIEKYNTAANTFYGKYGYLPGDMPAAPAAQFGFAARGQYAGEGDGNGLIEGISANAAGNNFGMNASAGETVMFWVDLSSASLIDGSFTAGSEISAPGYNVFVVPQGGPLGVSNFLPAAKIGRGNFLSVYSGGTGGTWRNGGNYFNLSVVTELATYITSTPGLTVQEAYSIDNKIDDGYPQTGKVTAVYLSGWSTWVGVSPGTAATPSATTCYDNGGNASNAMAYSLSQNNGAGVNCALSFRMQAGD